MGCEDKAKSLLNCLGRINNERVTEEFNNLLVYVLRSIDSMSCLTKCKLVDEIFFAHSFPSL